MSVNRMVAGMVGGGVGRRAASAASKQAESGKREGGIVRGLEKANNECFLGNAQAPWPPHRLEPSVSNTTDVLREPMVSSFQVIDRLSPEASELSMPKASSHHRALLLTAGAARDAAGTDLRDAAILIQGGRIAYCGPRQGAPAPATVCGEGVERMNLGPGVMVLPAMVNAHAHLELTSIGPKPYGGDFLDWVRLVMEERPQTPAAHAESVRKGVDMSIAGGVIAVGDIGSVSGAKPTRAVLKDVPLMGVLFDEVLGLEEARWRPSVQAAGRWARQGALGLWKTGIEGHAPYTTPLTAMLAAAEHTAQAGGVLKIHAAELLEEDAFVRTGDGVFRERFEAMGFWSPEVADQYGRGLSPIQWLEPVLRAAPCLLAHCNYLSDEDIALIAATGTSVVYCPLASAYYGHAAQTPHRYRDLLAAGVNVCLGTDSILCQPPGSPTPMGLLPAMRLLFQRDGVSPELLLEMATMRGIRGLGLGKQPDVSSEKTDLRNVATLLPGAPGRVIGVGFDPLSSVDPLKQVLSASDFPGSLRRA